MKLGYSEDAVQDLARLRELIAEHGPQGAARAAKRLGSGIGCLVVHPKLGHPVARAPDPESVRDLAVDAYVVRYALLDSRILILRIWL